MNIEVDDGLAAFGFDTAPPTVQEFQAAGTFWRDGGQNLFIADGKGFFRLHAGFNVQEKVIGEEAAGKTLHQVADEHTYTEVHPPSVGAYLNLISYCQGLGKGWGDWADEYLKELGVEIKSTGTGLPLVSGLKWCHLKQVMADAKKAQAEHDAEVAAIDMKELAAAPEVAFDDGGLVVDVAAFNKALETVDAPIKAEMTVLPPEKAENAVEMVNALGFAKVQPADIAITNEDGEVLNVRECFKVAGIELDEALPVFTITDKDSFEWFIKIIRRLQHEIEDIALSAAKMIHARVAAITGLMFYYGPQARAYAEPLLPVVKSGAKAGNYRQKFIRCLFGGAYWKKTGGLKVWSEARAIEWIKQSVEPEAWAEWGLVEEKKLVLKRTALYERIAEEHCTVDGVDDLPPHELGQFNIGGEDRAWSFAAVKKSLKDSMKAITLRNDVEDE